MITTTLTKIYAARPRPCGIRSRGETGYSKLLAHLGKTEADDEPLPLTVVLDSNGLTDALWCVRIIDSHEHKYYARLALSFADDVRHLMRDERSTKALDVAHRYIGGRATITEMRDSYAAAIAAAAYSYDAAAIAAAAAANAAYAYGAYAYGADAVNVYAYAYAAAAAVVNAVNVVDDAAIREKQNTRLRRFFETGEITQ